MQAWLSSLGDVQLVLLVVGCVSTVVILFYYFFFFIRIAFHKSLEVRNENLPDVSVIICARNEEQNIIDLLPKVLSQQYPASFEVVVVNDGSWDGTGDELKELAKTHPQLQLVTIEDHIQHRSGKKFALTLGIKKARYNHFVLTDADCFPKSEYWLQQMAAGFSKDKEIVLGAGPYAASGGLLNALIRFESYLTGTFFLSFALAGLPYMGVGRNLAYTRQAYERVGGFKKHYHIASGDDDLFVRDAATAQNTTICIHPDALVVSHPAETWTAWWRQKKRHYTTAPHYRWGVKFLLAIYPMAVLLFLVAVISLLVYENSRHIALIGLGSKIMLQLIIFRLTFAVQSDRLLWLASPVLEAILLLNQAVVAIMGLFVKQSRWK